jgi:GH24 family phage-related lysozyme (muramidase)
MNGPLKVNRLFRDGSEIDGQPAESVTDIGSSFSLGAKHAIADLLDKLLERDPHACLRDAQMLIYEHVGMEVARRVLIRRRREDETHGKGGTETKS